MLVIYSSREQVKYDKNQSIVAGDVLQEMCTLLVIVGYNNEAIPFHKRESECTVLYVQLSLYCL